MSDDSAVETVLPGEIKEGDVIKDPAADRWFAVHEIQILSGAGKGVYSFYDRSPDDAITVAGDETVQRRKSPPRM
jgi:hypothetical protein